MANNENVDAIVGRLIELRFFKFTPLSEMNQGIDMLRDSLTGEGTLNTLNYERDEFIPYRDTTFLPLDRRIYLVFADDLTKGEVSERLETMKPTLGAEGVQLHSVQDELGPNLQSYSVHVNGQTFKMYDESERDRACFLTHKRMTLMLSALLLSAGSRERAYGMSSGSDAKIALLTEELYAFIRSLPLPDNWKPYRFEELECE